MKYHTADFGCVFSGHCAPYLSIHDLSWSVGHQSFLESIHGPNLSIQTLQVDSLKVDRSGPVKKPHKLFVWRSDCFSTSKATFLEVCLDSLTFIHLHSPNLSYIILEFWRSHLTVNGCRFWSKQGPRIISTFHIWSWGHFPHLFLVLVGKLLWVPEFQKVSIKKKDRASLYWENGEYRFKTHW